MFDEWQRLGIKKVPIIEYIEAVKSNEENASIFIKKNKKNKIDVELASQLPSVLSTLSTPQMTDNLEIHTNTPGNVGDNVLEMNAVKFAMDKSNVVHNNNDIHDMDVSPGNNINSDHINIDEDINEQEGVKTVINSNEGLVVQVSLPQQQTESVDSKLLEGNGHTETGL